MTVTSIRILNYISLQILGEMENENDFYRSPFCYSKFLFSAQFDHSIKIHMIFALAVNIKKN